MACTHCGAVVGQDRFCGGCGRAVPARRLQPMGSSRSIPDDLTQPVLRLARRSRPEVPPVGREAGDAAHC